VFGDRELGTALDERRIGVGLTGDLGSDLTIVGELDRGCRLEIDRKRRAGSGCKRVENRPSCRGNGAAVHIEIVSERVFTADGLDAVCRAGHGTGRFSPSRPNRG